MDQTTRLPMALTAYGLPHAMGYLATRDGAMPAEPLGVDGVIAAAVEMNLAGIEVPLPGDALRDPAPLRDALQARGLAVVPDLMALIESDTDEVKASLRAAAALGAPVVRALISRILCGDRRSLGPGGWEQYLRRTAEILREVLPLAEELGVCLAIENHQDASSGDLLRLGEMVGNSPAYGVTLDTGNPLAVGEGPVEFARRLAPLIRHIHLKDYTIHFAPEGYRLVRCPAGDGVIDFPAILAVVGANGHALLPGIEVAAQQTRTIPLLEADWWEHFPPTPAVDLLPALRVLWAKGRPAEEPYSSAWERGEDSAAVVAEEWDVVRRSVAYFRGLAAG